MIRAYKKDEPVERLYPILERWLSECNANDFGITVDMPDYIDTVNRLINFDDCDLMVMEYHGEIIGIMGITSTKSPIGRQVIANVLYWYTLPEHRGKGISFVHEARRWAVKQNCSHIIFNASTLGGNLHDRVCRIYEHSRMKKFETSYILKLGD